MLLSPSNGYYPLKITDSSHMQSFVACSRVLKQIWPDARKNKIKSFSQRLLYMKHIADYSLSPPPRSSARAACARSSASSTPAAPDPVDRPMDTV